MRTMLAAVAIMVAGGAVAGCRHEPAVDQLAQRCEAYGYPRGTDLMAGCIQQEAMAWRAEDQARRARGAAVLLGSGVFTPPPPAPAYVPPVRTNCRPTVYGASCYSF